MKTKLTLTVNERVILRAKRHSKKTGKSLSRMFEELFEAGEQTPMKTEAARAAGRLLDHLEKSKPVKTLNDKSLLQKHLIKKYG
ncbi:MAG: DUF6364 family protein [Chitinophagales bacterium]|nr:DUF6364 family protein [Chitinophagales bacterium]